jgi:hypothetical protein
MHKLATNAMKSGYKEMQMELQAYCGKDDKKNRCALYIAQMLYSQ